MHLTPALVAVILAYTSSTVLAAPLPQLAGEGAACNSIFSSTDNGIGYGIENAENNIASNLKGKTVGRRQLAGEGALCDSIFSSTDNGIGYGIENAENNIASTISGTTGGAGKGGAPPPPPPHRARRQLDKVAAGFQNVAAAAGLGDAASSTTTELESLDGTLTSDAANAGQQIGDAEAGTLEGIGSSILKKRQLDKIAAGMQNIGSAAGVGDLTSPATTGLEGIDGTLTGAAADTGAEIGDMEAGTLEAIGNSVP